ncbi:hypothetical protein QTP88_013859 [Uroleucon formosanum]
MNFLFLNGCIHTRPFRVRSELSKPSPIKKILSLTDFMSELRQVWTRNGAGSDMSEQASDRTCLRYATDIFSSFSIHSSEDLSVIMDSKKLIELVKLHVGLYDLSSPNYSDSTWKEKVWKDIADELNQTFATCKNRWNNLRDMYRKALKRNKTTSGQATKIIKKYKYEDQLDFLKEFLQETDTIANVSCNISSSSEGEETMQGTQVNIEDKQMNKEKHEPIWKRPKRTKNHQEKYEKKEMEAKTENLVHLVDAFLSGNGTTLKTLDPYNLNLAKSRIFNIVQEIELNQILYKQTADTIYNNSPNSSSAGNPCLSTHNLYNKQSTSFSVDSSYTGHSNSLSPQMQGEMPLHTIT